MMREYSILRFDRDDSHTKVDQVASEVQFTLFVNQLELATFLCSPSDLVNLGLGYLISEGIVQQKEDVVSFDFQEMENYVNITLNPSIPREKLDQNKKVLTSGCGKGSIFLRSLQEINLLSFQPTLTFPASSIYPLMRQFQMSSEIFLATGGVHSVALCSTSEILIHKEDIGRHNAVDKILGDAFQRGTPTTDKALLLSGRMAVEIVQKAGRAGIQILLSKSAPTSMAIDMANKIGMTLVGFIRGDRMNVYTHSKRIISS
jgi:FdhD protein